jgi:ArsR family transcriptional regulator
VSQLQAALGMEPAAVSQQLAALRTRRLVEGRKVGSSVLYRVRDPEIWVILDAGRKLFESHLAEMRAGLEAEPAIGAERKS